MRDHTPNFIMHELSNESKALIKDTVIQLVEKLAGDGELKPDSHLEFWVEVPGVRHPRGTFRSGFLMPDSFLCLADWFKPGVAPLAAADEFAAGANPVEAAWNDLLDELYFQIEIFTSQEPEGKGVTVEIWAGSRQRPEGEWLYAVDRKIELA